MIQEVAEGWLAFLEIQEIFSRLLYNCAMIAKHHNLNLSIHQFIKKEVRVYKGLRPLTNNLTNYGCINRLQTFFVFHRESAGIYLYAD